MLTKASVAKPHNIVAPEEAIKNPCVLEFLELKDEYSDSQLEAALIERLETFVLELVGDFAFTGLQRHRLRCLGVIDLKIGSFTHAEAGQMHVCLNYAREHWALRGENPPVGRTLCASNGTARAHHAPEGLPNKVLAAEHRMALPDEEMLPSELDTTRQQLAATKPGRKQ